MAEHCTQCGAELLPNMRFCRFCGTPTSSLSPEEAATRPFPTTAPTKEPPVSPTRPVYLPPDQPYTYAGAPIEQPRRKRRWPWVLGFVLGFIVLILGAAGYGLYRLSQTPGVEIEETEGGIIIKKDGETIGKIGVNVDREAASEDTITRTIPLAPGGTFALSAEMGDVQISTWDEETIFIEAKKHRGSAKERKQLDVEIDTSAPDIVTVRTKRPSGSQAHLDYEIKLPRQVNIEQINTVSGDVQINGVNGNIAVQTVSGDVQMKDIIGNANVNTTSGDMRLELSQGSDLQDMNFNSVSGDIDLTFQGDFNANLDILTLSGDITVRGRDLQVFTTRELGNKKAGGHIGQGGPHTIHIKTVSGDIQLTH